MIFLCYLQCQRVADITCQTHIQPRTAKHIKNQRGSRGLTIRTSYANHFGIGVTCCKLNLREDRCALFCELLHQRSCQWNTWRFDDFVGIQYPLWGMFTSFPRDVVLIQQGLVHRSNRSHIADKDVHTFFFGQYGCPCARFACA